MRISDWSSDVCSSDLDADREVRTREASPRRPLCLDRRRRKGRPRRVRHRGLRDLPARRDRGLIAMRREFNLGPDDIRVLETLGCPWETIAQGGARWLLLRQHPIPEGYNVAQADVAIRLDAYPEIGRATSELQSLMRI